MENQELYERLEHATRKMRTAQKEYFNPRTRTTEVLQRSKQWEREVDKLLQEIDAGKQGRQLHLL